MHRVSDHVRDLHHRSLNLNQFQWVMAMMISHHRMGDNGKGPDRVIEYILIAQAPQAPQVPQIQPVVIQESVTVPDEDHVVVNPLSPSDGPSSSIEQRGRSRRQQRSRSRERALPHVPPHADEFSKRGTTEWEEFLMCSRSRI